MSLNSAIQSLKDEMLKAGIEQEHGLGTELFHFSSTLAPVVNIDLLVIDKDGRVLLSWRDDAQTGKGWHIPGSCIRFHETIEDAIQRCAKNELGSLVYHSKEPIKVCESLLGGYRKKVKDQRERAHSIALVFACRLPQDYDIKKHNIPNGEPGHLKWFNTMPEGILPIQDCYRRDWEELRRRANHEMEK